MASEHTAMRELLRTWLLSISDLTALVGSGDSARIYVGWPTTVPTFPMVTFATSRAPAQDYPTPAYQGALVLSLYSPEVDELDSIEEAIQAWFEGTNNNIEATLANDTVRCVHMSVPPEVPLDEYITGQHEMSLITAVRTLRFEPFVYIGLGVS